MTVWYQINQRLYRRERAALEATHPGMDLDIQGPGFRINDALCLSRECAVATGTYSLRGPETGFYDYRIAVIPPDNYPAAPCVIFCNDPKLPIGAVDRHILSNGQACLAVPGDLHRRWKPDAGIVGFLEEFVSPFLAWQVFFDAHGSPPPWGQRSHGVKGIIEFYAEALGIAPGPQILAFVSLLARHNAPKGHELCPCGSGRRLRVCHISSLRRAREIVPWYAVSHDLDVLDNQQHAAGQTAPVNTVYGRAPNHRHPLGIDTALKRANPTLVSLVSP